MPTKHSIPFRTKLHAVGLVDAAKQSLRKVSMVIGVAKSTLHDNLDHYRSEAAAFEQHQCHSERRLVKDILLVSFEGKTSARDCANIITAQTGQPVSHQKVLKVLSEIAITATKKNIETIPLKALSATEDPPSYPLASVKCGAFDEIFQKKTPILGFVDPVSAYVFLEKAPDRSTESWSKFLLELKRIGLNPESTVTDSGQGMLRSIKKVFPNALRMRDVFHVFQKLSRALNALEGSCYRMIIAYDRLIAIPSSDGEKIKSLSSKLEKAIQLYDALDREISVFKKACYFENSRGYVGANQMQELIERIIALIECAERNSIKHRTLKEARSYLSGAKSDIVAYKFAVEKAVEAHFGSANLDTILGYLCPMIECLDQTQRSYENRKRKAYWAEKLIQLRQRFRQFDFIDQTEVDKAIDSVATMMRRFKKSNSLIEAVNSVIRRHLVTHKSIPSWFCPIFTFYWGSGNDSF